MAQFIEITNTFDRIEHPYTMAQKNVPDTAPVMIAVAHIVSVQPVWNEEEVWTHTNVHMSNGVTWKTGHLTDEIERAIRAEQFCARVLS